MNLKHLLLVLIFSLISFSPAVAQNSTSEAEPTVVLTVPAEVVATDNPVTPIAPDEVSDEAGTPTTSEQFNLAMLLDFGKWIALLATVLVGGRALLKRIDAYLTLKKSDVGFMTKGEGVGAWTPQSIKDEFLGAINDGINVGRSIHDIASEWFDGVPYAAKLEMLKQKQAAQTKQLPNLPE